MAILPWRPRRSGVHASAKLDKARVSVSPDSRLEIGEGCVIEGAVTVTGGSELVIGDGCRLRVSRLAVEQRGSARLGNGVVFDGGNSYPTGLVIEDGAAEIAERCQIYGFLHVRFGGHLRIGAHTILQYASEIRCDEAVTLGEFCMISYRVRILDTDTHTKDWQERRRLILADYPNGVRERNRPNTRPVRIGGDVWIGEGATITKGAIIGDRSRIGMRCVVGGKEIPPDSSVVSPEPRIL